MNEIGVEITQYLVCENEGVYFLGSDALRAAVKVPASQRLSTLTK